MWHCYVNPRLSHLKIGRFYVENMVATPVILIAVNQQDIASTNQADALTAANTEVELVKNIALFRPIAKINLIQTNALLKGKRL